MLFTTSRTSKLGILQDHPVPIPSAPFISTMGIIGMYHSGSTRWLSSYKNLNVWSSFGGNNNRAKGLKKTKNVILEKYWLWHNFHGKNICYLRYIHENYFGFTCWLIFIYQYYLLSTFYMPGTADIKPQSLRSSVQGDILVQAFCQAVR